ncbi:MAG: protoheme IX farnesyltransferase [Desulfuromonadales bacterium]|nr:protoheme IX farnesyltransferase [Desulfuromonadales bacterium]
MIRMLARLFRLRLSLMNGAAALGGCLLFPAPRNGVTLLAACAGVSLLAMGGSALNQVLERRLDALMTRTLGRPLPQGNMNPATAAIIGGCVIMAGLMLIAAFGGALPCLLGLAALAWYLAVYTPLKQRTPMALPIGALCGALPPVIGWCLAGGPVLDFRIMLLAGLLYLWQVPHFLLFQQRHAADYRRAGIQLPENSRQFLGLWLAALMAASMLLPAFGIIGQHAACWYVLLPVPLLVLALCRCERPLFSYLNLFPLLVSLALVVQG